jgi:hypothetical protein
MKGYFHAYKCYTFPNYYFEMNKCILAYRLPYFIINVKKQYYSWLGVADLSYKGESTKVCPAEKVILRCIIAICEPGVFFSKSAAYEVT